ncbi:MAG: membrane dipeptidase [Chlamydiota bacterium]
MIPIVDLHCDLLSFLAEKPSHTTEDPGSNASYPQMKQGNVTLQTLAIFTDSSPSSFLNGKKQLEALKRILTEESDRYQLFDPSTDFTKSHKAISIIPAFENASGFSSDETSLDQALSYLDSVLNTFKRILYISLTWDGENRFGGGNGSKKGLKEDGKLALQWMHEKKIAIDLSHTSDFLADDILNYLDKKSLKVPVLASHSNARSVTNKERNLPDFLIKEIITRKGVIGLNFFAPFIGKESKELIKHVEHIFFLQGEDSLCFGADFFPDLLSSYVQTKYQSDFSFFKELNNSSCYPRALTLLQEHLDLKDDVLQKIAHKNFQAYTAKNL